MLTREAKINKIAKEIDMEFSDSTVLITSENDKKIILVTVIGVDKDEVSRKASNEIAGFMRNHRFSQEIGLRETVVPTIMEDDKYEYEVQGHVKID